MEYQAKSTINHNGQEYKRGATISLSDEEAMPLKEAGVLGKVGTVPTVEETEEDMAPVEKPAKKPKASKEKEEVGESEPEEETTDFSGMTKTELQKELKSRKIEFAPSETKSDLVAKLEESEAASSDEGTEEEEKADDGL